MGQHGGFQRFDEFGLPVLRDKLFLHHAQREQRFTQAEGQRRADFQNGDAIGDHVVQVLGGLVVGGVTLKADVGELLQAGDQLGGGGGVVVKDLFVTELHAGLNHHSNDVLHAIAHALFGPDALVGGNGIPERLRLGDGQRVLRLGGAARNGHLAADDEHGTHGVRLFGLQLLIAAYGRLVQHRAPAGDDLGLQQTLGVISDLHAGVQMNFGESGAGVLIHQLHRVLHGLFFWQFLPGQGAEVVAGQNHHALRQADVLCHFQHHLVEVRRFHAGVAAELVHLIGGGLNQNRLVQLLGAAQRNLQHQLIGAAIGRNAAADALAALVHHFL